MKYAIVLPDGAADESLDELNGGTPLQAADLPHMDRVTRDGQLALVRTIPDGYVPGTDVGTMSLFGYDPDTSYTGRAPIEAAAQHLAVTDDQLVFRCNFITVQDGRMHDFTADHIHQDEANQLIEDLNALFAADPCAFHAGVSYRNLVLASHARQLKLTCQAPHDIPGQPVADYPPTGEGAERVSEMMQRAEKMLITHPVNTARAAAGRNPVTNIWLWGQGAPTVLKPFADRFGVNGAVITGVDIIRGLAVCMGMTLIEVDGATGYLDTNYAGKGQAGVDALDDYDLVVVHVEAPDEAGHEGNAAAKVDALQKMDEIIVGPLFEKLQQFDQWRIMVAADHPTPCSTKAHSSVPPPVCYAGTGIDADTSTQYTELAARQGGKMIDPGHALMNTFMRVK